MAVNERNCADDPPLLLLAGTLCDARLFEPMLRNAALTGRPVVHCDMTGLASAHGLAERALSRVSGPFIAVGFSLGAIVALEMAVLAPERVAAMALIAASGRDVPDADHAARRAAAMIDPGVLVGEVLWERSVAAAAQGDNALKETIVAMARSQPPGTLALQVEVALTRSDKRPLLLAMQMPAVVLGGAEDRIAPPELQRELAEGLPDAELVIAPGAGHFLPLECPDLCARTLADWLAHVRTLA
ncbi:alpha/beta fold hydrolase [Novosphingobium gossypii]|uniref:alpha/beta fold hydrolase n=1 Tax=Novosphingobium gossypii TaxID=1604774 RepID=UPI003D19D985